MAVGEVKRQGCEQWGVYIGGHCYGTFGALLDANCFAVQMIERGMVLEVRLYSGEKITEWVAYRLWSVA